MEMKSDLLRTTYLGLAYLGDSRQFAIVAMFACNLTDTVTIDNVLLYMQQKKRTFPKT